MNSVNVFEQNGDKEIYFVFNTELQNDDETPKTLQEAIDGPEGEEWKLATASEIMNFIKRKEWKKVPQSRPRELGKIIMKTKWVLKKKEQTDGSIRFKM